MPILPFVDTPYLIVGTLGLILILFLISLYLVGKHEKGTTYFVWLLLILFFPVVGPIAYFFKHFAHGRESEKTGLA